MNCTDEHPLDCECAECYPALLTTSDWVWLAIGCAGLVAGLIGFGVWIGWELWA